MRVGQKAFIPESSDAYFIRKLLKQQRLRRQLDRISVGELEAIERCPGSGGRGCFLGHILEKHS